jgi:hypothetical protein
MTHSEVFDELPALALNALDAQEAAAVTAHVTTCSICTAELASLELTAADLASALPQVAPPAVLRARLLDSMAMPVVARPEVAGRHPTGRGTSSIGPRSRSERRPWWPLSPFPRSGAARPAWLLAAGLALALIVTGAIGIINDRRQAQELALDRAALALLTSTEKTDNRLTPPVGAGLPEAAHGHWFHRPGVNTQVVVGEALPRPERGEYVVWLQRGGVWQRAGALPLDDQGYGRLVLLGLDGQDVGAVEITQETEATNSPSGKIVLRFP